MNHVHEEGFPEQLDEPQEKRGEGDMRTIRKMAVVLTAVALAMSLALPAVADKPPEKHRSCQFFGQVIFAGFAQTGEAGQIIAFNARNEVTAPWGTTYTPPGSIAEIVHDEQTQVDWADFAPGEGDDVYGCEDF